MFKSYEKVLENLLMLAVAGEDVTPMRDLVEVYYNAEKEAEELGYVGVGIISYAEEALINYQKTME